MQVDNIKFTQEEDGAVPSEVTVTMTIQEAIWIGLIAGLQRGGDTHQGIYNALVGDVFNRYWDDGVQGAREQFNPIEIPPMDY